MEYVSNNQLGAIAYFAANYAPMNWMPCDGTSLASSANTGLRVVFGGKYGEDNLTFNVPTLAPLVSNGEALPAIFIAVGVFPHPIPDELCFITPELSEVEPYLGLVVPYAKTDLPDNWVWCDGSLLKIKHQMALFSILGIRFGGDDLINFALPNIPGHIICIRGDFPVRL